MTEEEYKTALIELTAVREDRMDIESCLSRLKALLYNTALREEKLFKKVKEYNSGFSSGNP